MNVLKDVKLFDISKEFSIRSDMNYIKYLESQKIEKCISFYDIFEVIENETAEIDKLEDFKYCQIGDTNSEGELDPVIINFDEPIAELTDYYKKIKNGDIFKPKLGDILISKIRPYLKKIVYIDDNNDDVFFTKAFICLRPKINSIIAFFLLRCIWFNDLNSISRIGKGYPTLNVNDFRFIKFNDNCLNRINIIENSEDIMNELESCVRYINQKKDIISNKEIINNVFSKFFKYDKNIIFKLHKGMTYGTQMDCITEMNIMNVSFSSINDNNYRFSTRIKNTVFNDIYKKIENYPHIKIDNIHKELIKGVQPVYSDDGIKVIKIANLKNGNIDYDNVEYASEEYCDSLQDNKFLNINDIIICCTGKGSLGKVDIVENDERLITSVDNYILRIDSSKYNAKFLTYYLRSVFGIIQFEMNYSGMTNQIHFYDDNIKNIIIPDIDLVQQKNIAEEISKEISIRDKIKEKRIREKDNLIGKIENVMKSDK